MRAVPRVLPRGARVAVAVPSNGGWRDWFGWRLAEMLIHTKEACPRLPVRFFGYSSSVLPINRANLVVDARKAGCTHIFFLDSDMTFPPDALLRLLEHDRDIVVAAAPRRGFLPGRVKPDLVALEKVENGRRVPLQVRPGMSGLRPIARCGLAVAMLRLEIFDRLPGEAFEMRWDAAREHFLGEDETFFIAAEKAGIEAFVDLDLTREIGHIGATTLTFTDTL